MSFITEPQSTASFNRWDIPVKMGLLIGLIGIILTTVNFMFILPVGYVTFLVFSAVFYIVGIFLYFYTGVLQRKALGGYITLKQAFSAIFIAILISTLISTIWGIVYVEFIDPDLTTKIKENTLAMMSGRNVPAETLDETAKKFDDKISNSLKPGVLLLSLAQSIVLASILGFICAAIVKREPKLEMR